MTRYIWSTALVVSVVLMLSGPASAQRNLPPPAQQAQNYVGKLDLVQITSLGTRFFVKATGLSLFASGDHKDGLTQAFFRKASVSVGFSPVPCPGGLQGTCGNVVSVTVDSTGL
jgi:hypothetical protein